MNGEASSRQGSSRLEAVRSIQRHSKFGRCPRELDNGRVCGKTIISGSFCPAHGGGSRKTCPFELDDGQVCNGYIYMVAFVLLMEVVNALVRTTRTSVEKSSDDKYDKERFLLLSLLMFRKYSKPPSLNTRIIIVVVIVFSSWLLSLVHHH